MSNMPEESSGALDVSELLKSLLSNPEAFSKMSNILSNLASSANSTNPPQSNDNNGVNEELADNIENNTTNSKEYSPTFQNQDVTDILPKIPEILSKISSAKAEDSVATKQQIALLLAIKPYLSEHRKELIDTFIKMNKFGAIFKNLT